MSLNLQLKRQTLSSASAYTALEFDYKASRWLVKNLGSSDIYVKFNNDSTDTNDIKIPSMKGQVCTCPVYPIVSIKDYGATDTIYIKGVGEVEVQQL